ncbi:MAG TPA: hypothetical protein VHZ33_31865 [Trebonia sp.]|nr:hypothetical protein [Trebonia sp.]
MGEDLLEWAIRIRARVPELVETAQVAGVTEVLDGLIDDGRAFAAGFEEFLQREPAINDWLNRELNDAPEVYRSYKDLPGEMRFVPSGVIARCQNGHTWQLPDAAAWLPPCPDPGCGQPLSRL